jgi:gliding motility-associated-like protein
MEENMFNKLLMEDILWPVCITASIMYCYDVGYGLFVQQTTDGGYIISGFAAGGSFGGHDILLIKTDANGNIVWNKEYGGAGNDWGNYVEQTPDGGYIVAGYTGSYGAGANDLFLLKVDANGIKQWDKTYGGPSDEGSSTWGISGQATSDGGYMICGNTTSYGAGNNDVLLVKTDSVGNLQWAKAYGGGADEQPRFAHQISNGGYIICGYTTSFGFGDLDAYMIKTSADGTLLWSKAYGGPAYDKGQMVREASDNGFALSMITDNFGADANPNGEYFDPIFMKTDSMGVVGCYEANCATVVNSVNPTVGSGLQEMTPALVATTPPLVVNTYNATDHILCKHCVTVPTFVPSDTAVCVGDTVLFINTTSVGIRCFEDWYVENTLVDASKDTLTFVFNTSGIKLIQLIAQCGNNTDTSTIQINVHDNPVARIKSSRECRATTTIFTDSSSAVSGALNFWDWTFGDGSANSSLQNPTHLYPLTGSYTTTLIVHNTYGCADTTSDSVQFYNLPVANFGTAPVCVSTAASFHDSSTVVADSIALWSWNFGDNTTLGTVQHPTHNYLTAGTYTVTLIVTTNHGCKDTISQSIVIHPLPVVIFNANNVCDQNPALFINFSSIPSTDTIQSWTWNFGDSTALLLSKTVPGGHLYAHPGTYSVKLIEVSNFGCVDSVTNSISIRPNPVASFVSNRVCNGTATAFTDSSTTAAGSLSLWKWDFGDNTNPVYTQNTTHVYAAAGIHTTTLIVQNTFGCADTITKTCKVYFNPVASFTHQDVCLKDSMHFTSTSSVDTSSSLATYYWLFDDGVTSTLQNPSHMYLLQGTYHVTLVVKTVDSCSDAVTMTVQVFDPPTTQFTVNDVCLFDSAHFINTSVNPTIGTISNWTWNLGDGSPLNTTDLSPHHLYGGTGTYPIQLITHSVNLGCADTLNDSITVFPMPTAGFSTTEVCIGTPSNFTDVSVVANTDTITTWAWDFGGGAAFSAVQNPMRNFSTFGTYQVTLVVTTNHGCKDTVVHPTIIHPKPNPQFTTHNVCLGDVASFTDGSTIPSNTTNDGLAAWVWVFGDSSATNNNQHPNHLYARTGKDTIQLKVISDFGCVDSINHPIVINPNPVVAFIANDTLGCEPLCISLQDQSQIESGSNSGWSWNFGDNSATQSGNQVNHCYHNDSVTAPNDYTITLTVSSDSGCVSTVTKTNYITVYPLPHAAFAADPMSTTIANPVISVMNLSIGASSWVWNWGGTGDTNITIQSPLPHTYPDTGSYTITLLTSTQYQCLDSTQQTITIAPDFMFYIPNSFSPNDDGINDTFIGKGIFVKEYEMSIFDRWGNLIYKTDSIDKPWDGKANMGNQLAQEDVYVYVVKITNFKLEKHNFRGTVTLIR